jgi:DNA invertase Pin-like site-specific DNA recombinase
VEHIALYVRISRDQEGRAEGVADQETRARVYATERWPETPVVVYSDNDLSATNGDPRPGYESLVAAIRRGEVAQLVCAEQSRLTRVPAEWEDLVVTLAKAGISEVHTYRKGVVNVSGSKLVGRILAAVDAEEVERMRARVLDKHAALAAQGRPSGGGRQFGYQPDHNDRGEATLEVVPPEAEAARWAADALLSGWSLSAIAKRFRDDGVPTPRGGRWSERTVGQMLTKPTIAGLRGEVRATWEPILDESTWRQVCAVLDRRKQVKGRPRRRFLLTGGIARCGRPSCGAPLVAQRRRMSATSIVPYYQCAPPARGGCSRLGVVADPLEDHVRDELLAELDKPAFRAAFATDDHEERRAGLVQELGMIEERRAELGRLWAAREIDSTGWTAARQVLDVEHADLSAKLAAVPRPQVDVDPVAIRAGWGLMTLDEKRSLIELFIDGVIVAPAKPGARRFDPNRVTIAWRTV